MWNPPVLFAHRGAKAHSRENTQESFALARKLGATGMETDVWVTSDGVVVLDHDGLHRRFPRRWIRDVPYADLASHIPTIHEFYAEGGANLPFSVDVKDGDAFPGLVAAAREHDALDHLWLCHSDIDVLAEWRAAVPEVHLVNSTQLDRFPFGPEQRAAELARNRIEAVNLKRDDWTGGLTTLFHRFDVLCFGWDAQHEHQLASLIDMGMDAVYSDHVDRMVAVAEQFFDQGSN